MLMDIPLPTVERGLAAFARLEMIDLEDGIISIRNWRKYQSEDRLEARREKDRLRQQRHRKNSHVVSDSQPEPESRDPVTLPSRDVTLENRQEQNREEQIEKNRQQIVYVCCCKERPCLVFLIRTCRTWKKGTVLNGCTWPPISPSNLAA